MYVCRYYPVIGLGKRSRDPYAYGLGKRFGYIRDTEKRDPYAFGISNLCKMKKLFLFSGLGK